MVIMALAHILESARPVLKSRNYTRRLKITVSGDCRDNADRRTALSSVPLEVNYRLLWGTLYSSPWGIRVAVAFSLEERRVRQSPNLNQFLS